MSEDDLVNRFRRGERAALAKIITLVESSADGDDDNCHRILTALGGSITNTIRVAISGPPGVGKSTFINTLGKKIIAHGYKLAVLAIDPSSDISLGSILADKTRMKDLLSREDVYIRPSPSQGALGGLSFSTHDVVFVVEAFGFTFVIIETVGVGQTEMVARMLTDHFVVLVQPGAGDQLQAMKKGILERANFILVNKADLEQQSLAKKSLAALSAFGHNDGDDPPYRACVSALDGTGIDAFFQVLIERHNQRASSGMLAHEREQRMRELCAHLFAQRCAQAIEKIPSIKARYQDLAHVLYAQHQAVGPALAPLVREITDKLR